MATQYRKLTLEGGDVIFVRTKDFNAHVKVMEAKPFDPKKFVGSTVQMLIGSPEGMKKLHNGMKIAFSILEEKNIKMLENLRGLIDERLKTLNEIKKAKKEAKKKNERTNTRRKTKTPKTTSRKS